MVVRGAGIRARESQAPVQILICDDNGVISTASAFIFASGERHFLITNWHNVSGKDFLTGELLCGRAPTYLKARIATVVDEHGGFNMPAHRVDIYDQETREPLWMEHPELGRLCDVVALPFSLPSTTPPNLHVPVNQIHSIRIPVRPGSTVFIIGYPHNLSVHIGWPIWKSGYVASEPHYDATLGGCLREDGARIGGQTLPAFFIDSLTRKGMSGAPVFANFVGNWDMHDPYAPVEPDAPDFLDRDDIALSENRMEFVGAYSSRVPAEEGEAALGLCIKRSAIEAICEGGVQGKHPHFV